MRNSKKGGVMKKASVIFILLLVCALTGALTVEAATIVVTPSNLNGWTVTNLGTTGTSAFVTGIDTPPHGMGSWESTTTGPAGTSGNRIVYNSLQTTPLTQITEFSYWERHEDTGQPQGFTYSQPYVRIWVDLGNSELERLTFEPFFQQGWPGVGGMTKANDDCVWPTQNSITTAGVPDNTWYKWDLLAGAWYADGNVLATSQLWTIDALIKYYPGVTLVSGGEDQGFFHGQDGFNGNFAWKGYIDAFSLTTSTGGNTLWDFEPTTVPLPGSLLLVGSGLVGLATIRRKFSI
jgi:hypothetical protein